MKNNKFIKYFFNLLVVGFIVLVASFFIPQDQNRVNLGIKINSLSDSIPDNILVKASYSGYSHGPYKMSLKTLEDIADNQSLESNFAYGTALEKGTSTSSCNKAKTEIENTVKLLQLGQPESIYDLVIARCAFPDLDDSQLRAKTIEIYQNYSIKDWRYYYLYYKYFHDQDIVIQSDLTPAEKMFVLRTNKGINQSIGKMFIYKPDAEEISLVAELNKQDTPENLLALNLWYNVTSPYINYRNPLELIMQNFKTTDFSFINILFLVIMMISVIKLILLAKNKEKAALFSKEKDTLLALFASNLLIYNSVALNILPIYSNLQPLFYWTVQILIIVLWSILFLRAYRNTLRNYGILQTAPHKIKQGKTTKRLILLFVIYMITIALLTVIAVFIFSIIYLKLHSFFLVVLIVFLSIILFYFALALLMPYILQIGLNAKKLELENIFIFNKLSEICNKYKIKPNIWIIPTYGLNLMNAAQSGMAKINYRIFITDKLVDSKKFTIEEIQAIFIHEITHFKKKHIAKRVFIIFSFVIIYNLIFAVSSLVFQNATILAFADVIYLILILLFAASLFRKQEREADLGVAGIGLGKEFISGLRKITDYNLMIRKFPKLLYLFSFHGDFESRKKNVDEYLKRKVDNK